MMEDCGEWLAGQYVDDANKTVTMKKEGSDLKIMEEMERKKLQDRYIRFDWAIKRLLRQKANFDVLEGFLTVFIGERITIVELLESEGSQLSAEDKFTMSPAERHAYDEHLSAIMSKTTYLIPLS